MKYLIIIILLTSAGFSRKSYRPKYWYCHVEMKTTDSNVCNLHIVTAPTHKEAVKQFNKWLAEKGCPKKGKQIPITYGVYRMDFDNLTLVADLK